MERMEEQGEVDISRSESVEHELNRLIEKRHDQRAAEEGHTPSEELWKASVRRYNRCRQEANRLAWRDYFERLAACLRARAEEYDHRAQMLMEDQPKGAA
jgi:hypothetical protein